MTPKEEKLRGQDAQSVLQNPAFKMAVDKIDAYLEGKMQSCKPDDKDQAQALIIAKQMHHRLTRELELLIQNGEHVVDITTITPEKDRVFKR